MSCEIMLNDSVDVNNQFYDETAEHVTKSKLTDSPAVLRYIRRWIMKETRRESGENVSNMWRMD